MNPAWSPYHQSLWNKLFVMGTRSEKETREYIEKLIRETRG
jgi:hypothetical protein